MRFGVKWAKPFVELVNCPAGKDMRFGDESGVFDHNNLKC